MNNLRTNVLLSIVIAMKSEREKFNIAKYVVFIFT